MNFRGSMNRVKASFDRDTVERIITYMLMVLVTLASSLLSARAAGGARVVRGRPLAAFSTAAPAALEVLNTWRCFGGTWTRYKHESVRTSTPMTFSVFTPPGASAATPMPAIFFLSGLTCTDVCGLCCILSGIYIKI